MLLLSHLPSPLNVFKCVSVCLSLCVQTHMCVKGMFMWTHFFEEPRRGHWMLWNWKNWSQILCTSNRWFGLISQLFSPVSFITRRIRERECMMQISQVCEMKSKSFHLLHMYSRQLFIHLSQSLFYISCHVFLWLLYETIYIEYSW